MTAVTIAVTPPTIGVPLTLDPYGEGNTTIAPSTNKKPAIDSLGTYLGDFGNSLVNKTAAMKASL